MTAYEARQTLIQLKRVIRDRKGLDAIDKALQALAWQEVSEKRSVEAEDNLNDIENEELTDDENSVEIDEDSFEQQEDI